MMDVGMVLGPSSPRVLVGQALLGVLYMVKDLSGLYRGGGMEANAGEPEWECRWRDHHE
jgi:hypothetical protein